jgi:hypothetical protein
MLHTVSVPPKYLHVKPLDIELSWCILPMRNLDVKIIDVEIHTMRDIALTALAPLRAYPNNPVCQNFVALQSHEIYPISVKRIGS